MKKVITLKNGGYTAQIRADKGANCVALHHEATGASLLRTPPSEEEYAQNPNVYGMPLLFPPNRIKDGRYAFRGLLYQFPINEEARHHHIHGVLSVTAFDVVEQRADYACFQYRAHAQNPYLHFPHAFTVTVEYGLGETGLTQRLTVKNDGDKPMPFGAGFHTSLNVPFMPDGSAEDCRLSVTAGKVWAYDERIIPTGETWDAQTYREGVPAAHIRISEHMDMGKSGGVAVLVDEKAKARIVYEAGEGYRYWMLFNQGGEMGYICPEPQTWMVDAPNRPFPPAVTGFDAIAPGDQRVVETKLYLELLEKDL